MLVYTNSKNALIQDAIRLHLESRLARNELINREVGSHKAFKTPRKTSLPPC